MSLRALPPLLLAFLLAACQQSAPSTRSAVAPSAPSALGLESAPAAANAQSVERPNSGHVQFNVDHIQLPEGCFPTAGPYCPKKFSLFGGACSIASNFMEFGKGSGEMTHGGRVEVTWHHCTLVSAAHEITFMDGVMTMVTANGDKVTFSYGTGALTIHGDSTWVDSLFAVTGGTGRFGGASGAGTMHGEAPGATPGDLLGGRPFETTIAGTITYAPGRRGQ